MGRRRGERRDLVRDTHTSIPYIEVLYIEASNINVYIYLSIWCDWQVFVVVADGA